MKENTTTELLRSLSEQELADLELFLQSPYFNRGVQAERILRLYAVLRSAGGDLPDKAALASDIFAGEPVAPGKTDKLLSEFNGLLREFLLLQHLKNTTDAFNEALHWAVILRQKGLIKRYDAAMQKAEKVLKAEQVESVDYYYNEYKLSSEIYEAETRRNTFRGDLFTIRAINSLDKYYSFCRTELINLLLLLGKIIYIGIPNHLLAPQDINHLELSEENILIQIANRINRQLLSSRPSPDSILEIFNLLVKYENKITPLSHQNYFSHIRNLCALRVKSGDNNMLPVLHDIQKYSLDKGYVSFNGKMAPSAYLNIVLVATSIHKTDWALTFIEQYKDSLFNDELKEDYYSVVKAICLFSVKQYNTALDTLPASIPDTLFLTYTRRLEIKCYYELQSELLPYKIEAYKVFLSRASKKLLSPDIRDFEGNFVNLLLQIINCPPGDAFKLDRLERRIREKTTVADRDWLLLKVAELGRK